MHILIVIMNIFICGFYFRGIIFLLTRDPAMTIQGWLLFEVWCLFEEIWYHYQYLLENDIKIK